MTRAELIQSFISSSLVTEETIAQHLGEATAAVARTMEGCLDEFSRDVPRRVLEDIEWQGTAILLEEWGDASRLLEVEAPRDQRPRMVLDAEDIDLDQEVGSLYLVLATGTACRARYTAQHVIAEATGDEEGAITIPTARVEAFHRLVASEICRKIAIRHAETQRGNMSDAVEYQSKTDRYLKMAKDLRVLYREMIGAAEQPMPSPAEATVEYEQPSWRIF